MKHSIIDRIKLIKRVWSKSSKETVSPIEHTQEIIPSKDPKFIDSIKHLEKNSQEELTALIDLIRKYVPSCAMIILFGSYAKGKEVIYDEYYVDGVRTSYQSDFDIMIILPNVPHKVRRYRDIERHLKDRVTEEYNEIFSNRLHAPPQFIVENIFRLDKNLKRKHPFFTDIVTEGIMLYDNGKVVLPEPQELSFREIKEIAEEQFEQCAEYADGFLEGGYFYLKKDFYGMAAFQLHQACENYYRSMGMVFDNYNPKLHDLEVFITKTKGYSRDLVSVFPKNTDFEKNSFKLLCEAYIRARYDTKYVVTKEELIYMLERVEILKEIAHRLCKERLEHYNNEAKKQESGINSEPVG